MILKRTMANLTRDLTRDMTRSAEAFCAGIVRKWIRGLYGVSPHQEKAGVRRLTLSGEREGFSERLCRMSKSAHGRTRNITNKYHEFVL